MATLIIEVEGRTLRFDSAKVIRIGRSIEADVVLTAGSVSRAHAELRPFGDAWLLVDTNSGYGTFVDGTRISQQQVTGSVTVQCGPEARGSSFTVVPEGAVAPPHVAGAAQPVAPAPPPPSAPVPPPYVSDAATARPPTPGAGTPPDPPRAPVPPAFDAFDQTQVLAPAGGGPFVVGGPPPRSGPDLLVVADGKEYRFRHPSVVRIGRQPDCDIVIADPVASRMHAEVTAVPGGWSYRNTSSEGSFDQGRRIDVRGFEERLDLRLGHPVAGPAVSLVPILSAQEEERRFARKRRRKALLVAAAVVAVLGLAGGTVVAAVELSKDEVQPTAQGSRTPTPSSGAPSTASAPVDTLADLTTEELESAKDATVLLIGETRDDDGTFQYSGSGSILTPDGLILTNAHVAAPEAAGLEEEYGDQNGIVNPDYLLVALVDAMDDSPAEPAFRARLVTADGVADAAVIRIFATADGTPVDPASLNLPTMRIGDSDTLQSGDDVTVLGFPGISGSSRLTVTKGVISTIGDHPGLGDRSEIDTDARIAPGNSGGAAINNDAQLIGIPSALFSGGDSPVVSGRIRPINVVRGLIDEAETEVGD